MATVTTATVGAASVTVALVGGGGLVLDVFPVFFPVTFGVELDAPTTTFVTPSGQAWDVNGYYRSALILTGTDEATVILSGSSAGASTYRAGIVTLPLTP